MANPILVTVLPTHWAGDRDHMWDDHMWGGGWMWLWGPLVVLAVLAAVALVVWLVTRSSGASDRDDGNRRAREILGERYARGELSTEEYDDRLQHLR
ncbi:MAG TPA: SHOCT domain-containing protein [Acidimicrobiales bacterium]|nr:SHOCT domain-containing protein [Acidimicrobiales bacterium]